MKYRFRPSDENPFRSFLMAGFECADHQNAFGQRIDLTELTGHDRLIGEDYENLREIGIATVREGIRWSFVEKRPFEYDWSQVEDIIIHAQTHHIQVVWDICHFGFPDDLTPLHPMFARRFAHLCCAFVKKYRSMVTDGELIVTPINEVSFLSWLGGEVKGTSPYSVRQGWEVKYMLMKAYIEGIEMMKETDPSVQIMPTEPLIHISASDPSDPALLLEAHQRHLEQFQVLDILTGKICPELRGKPEYLDFIGVNFYFNNQWTIHGHRFISWDADPPNPLWKNLSILVSEVYLLYGRPIVISETSIPEHKRYSWLKMISRECLSIIRNGIPLYGCCIYPIIDRPDWDFPDIWHHSGLWDIPDPDSLQRKIHYESLLALNEFRQELSDLGLQEEVPVTTDVLI